MSGVRVEGDIGRFQDAIKNLSDIEMKELNQVLGEAVRTGTIERFENSEDPEGNRWRNSIRANTEGGKTLVQSAGLKNSIAVRATAKGFAVGTNKKYAAIHQFGGTIRAKSKKGLIFKINGKFARKQEVEIPARPFLGISDSDKKEVKSTMDEYMGELIK